MSEPNLKQIVEALLFAADAPVPLDKLVEIVGGDGRADIRKTIDELVREYDEASRPFAIAEVAGGWQLYCRPDYVKWVRELHRGRMPTRLSQAALETLAIVAYKQPIVRAEIEVIRGVDSSGVLATLLRRNLIAIAGRAPGMGRALMYRTTREFLRYFGLNTITDLPRLEEFAEVLGLRPDELELAIEGAESLAGIAADVEGEDVSAPDDVPEGAAGLGDAPDAPADDRAEAADGSSPETTVAPDEDLQELEHATIIIPNEPAGETPAPSRILPGPDSGVHPISDRKILESTDET